MPKHSRAEEIEDARQLIRNAGLRSTPARISVLQELRQASNPLTHADVAEKLVPRGFDKATIFRNLADLAEANLVRRSELGDHVWRFEVIDPDHHNEQHPHFVCIDCGSVTCLEAVEFTASSKRRSAGVGHITEVLLKGHCSDCYNVDVKS